MSRAVSGGDGRGSVGDRGPPTRVGLRARPGSAGTCAFDVSRSLLDHPRQSSVTGTWPGDAPVRRRTGRGPARVNDGGCLDGGGRRPVRDVLHSLIAAASV